MNDTLLTEGQALQNGLPRALSLPTSEQLEKEITKRMEYKLAVQKEINELKRTVHNLEELIADLRLEQRRQQKDIDVLDSQRWTLIHEEKQSRSGRPVGPTYSQP